MADWDGSFARMIDDDVPRSGGGDDVKFGLGTVIIMFIIGVILAVAVVIMTTKDGTTTVPMPTRAAGSAKTETVVAQVRPQRDQAEFEAMRKEGEQMMRRNSVRGRICAGIAARYLSADKPVDLQRQVQLSQANGCGWRSIMDADAAKHGLGKADLEAAKEISEEDVTAVQLAS